MSSAARGDHRSFDDPGQADPFADAALAELGLRVGARVRFRRRKNERWRDAVVERRERDGSLGLRDERGAARSITIEAIEVRSTGPRGGAIWAPLAEVASAVEQRRLL